MKTRPSSIIAILFGASKWPKIDLPHSASFENSAEAAKTYITDSDGLGVPPDDLLWLFDSDASANKIDETISCFIAKRLAVHDKHTVTILVWYIGHGAFGPKREYCLTLRDTREDSPYHSSLSMQTLAHTLCTKALWARCILILDACFSATAVKYFHELMGAPMEIIKSQITDLFAERGMSLFCAAEGDVAALAPSGHAHTMFSGALLHVLTDGEPSLPRFLTLEQVARLTDEHICKKYKDQAVRPVLHSPKQPEGPVSRAPIFPNAAFQEPNLAMRINQMEAMLRELMTDAVHTHTNQGIEARLARLEHLIGSGTINHNAFSAPPLGIPGIDDRLWRALPPELKFELYAFHQERALGRQWLMASTCCFVLFSALCLLNQNHSLVCIVITGFVSLLSLVPLVREMMLRNSKIGTSFRRDGKSDHIMALLRDDSPWSSIGDLVLRAVNRPSCAVTRGLRIHAPSYLGATALWILTFILCAFLHVLQ